MHKCMAGLVIVATLAASAVHAAEDCKTITDPKTRLACYDQASKSDQEGNPPLAADATPKPAIHFAKAEKRVGSWLVSIDEDEFSNQNKIIVMEPPKVGNITGLRCFAGSPSFAFDLPFEKLQSGEAFNFKMRVDGGQIHDLTGEALNDTVVQSSLDTGLLQQIIDGNVLHVRFTNSEGTSMDESFSLNGIGAALKEFSQLCPP